MKTPLSDSPALRVKRAIAYRAGKYRFSPPPVCHSNWDEQAWCNHVVFDDPALNGFLPYLSAQDYAAAVIAGSRGAFRFWDCSGLWEYFRLDHAQVKARTEKEARAKFRRRYKNPRSVTGITARMVG